MSDNIKIVKTENYRMYGLPQNEYQIILGNYKNPCVIGTLWLYDRDREYVLRYFASKEIEIDESTKTIYCRKD